MPHYILAHDMGTTGNKATLFADDGAIIASAFSAYPTDYKSPHMVEQSPEDWWDSVCASTRELALRAPLEMANICAIGLSGMMNGCVLVNDCGETVRPAIIHADTRSETQCRRFSAAFGEELAFHITGNRVAPYFTMSKLAWLVENEPESIQSAKWCVQTKDYIAGRLTGAWGFSDPSDASLTGCFDILADRWSEPIISAAAIPRTLLPEIRPSSDIVGRVTGLAAAQTGLRTGIPVVIGGGDGACATAGAGAVSDGDCYHYLGGTSWVATVTAQYKPDPTGRVCAFRTLLPQQSVVYGTVQSAGSSVDWINTVLFTEPDRAAAFQQLEAAAQAAPPGSASLFFLPYLSGERSPVWDAQARGVFFGLTPAHGRNEMARSVFEGVGFALAQNLEAIESVARSRGALRALGGGMRSQLWRSILAAVYGRPVVMKRRLSEATSCGAAMAAAVGVGICETYESAAPLFAPDGETEPVNQSLQEIYRRQMPMYRRLYPALKAEFNNLADATASRAFEVEPVHDANESRDDTWKLQQRIAELEAENAKLQVLVGLDDLTGLPNLRAFNERLTQECSRSLRCGSPLTLMLMDIDKFKATNDMLGHAAGDAALRYLAGIFRVSLRSYDYAARIGGDEFAVILPGTSVEGAMAVARRLHSAFLKGNELQQGLSVSIGVAQFSSSLQEPELFVKAADALLYRAKADVSAPICCGP